MYNPENPDIWADCLSLSRTPPYETPFTRTVYAWIMEGGFSNGVSRRHQALKEVPNFIDLLRMHATQEIDDGRPLHATIIKALSAANKLPVPAPPRCALLHVGRCKELGNYGPRHTLDALTILSHCPPSHYPKTHVQRLMFSDAAYDSKAVFDFYPDQYRRAVERMTVGMKLPQNWDRLAALVAAIPSAETMLEYLARIYSPLLVGYWNTTPFRLDGPVPRDKFLSLVHESLNLWELSIAATNFVNQTANNAEMLHPLSADAAKTLIWSALDEPRRITINKVSYTLIPLTSAEHLRKHGNAVNNCTARYVGVCLYQDRHMLAAIPTAALLRSAGVAPVDALMRLYERPLSADLMERIGTVLMAIKRGRLVRVALEIEPSLLLCAQAAVDRYAVRFMQRKSLNIRLAMLTREANERRANRPNPSIPHDIEPAALEQYFQYSKHHLTGIRERISPSLAAWCNTMRLGELAAVASMNAGYT